MKFDMHCHTAEGSIDAHVAIRDYIELLKAKGFGGMLVSDHDSYAGYEAYQEQQKINDFVVLKGVEYDTLDYGHMLVVMPEGLHLDILHMRGLTLKKLIRIVHYYGGILGPAHPCGEPFLGFKRTRHLFRKQKDRFLKQFDFIEIFNACESEKSNKGAKGLSSQYEKPGFGGSDAHYAECVGMGYTDLPESIKTESDLIQYVKQARRIVCDGERYVYTIKDKLGPLNKALVYAFYPYNKVAALLNLPKRMRELRPMIEQMQLETVRSKSVA